MTSPMSFQTIVHIADSHFDERHGLAENFELHMLLGRHLRELSPGLIVHSGDLYERKSSPAERNCAIAVIGFLSEIAPVVLVRGNHDAHGDLHKFRAIGRNHPVLVFDEATHYDISGFRVIALPWFEKSGIVARMDPAERQFAGTTATIGAARGLLATLATYASEGRARGLTPLLVGHVLVAGSEVSTGQTVIGQTVELDPASILDVGCEYAALGHIHKAQQWYDGRVRYAGSPQRLNFGELEDKGASLVTFREGRFERASFLQLPARKIVLVDCDVPGPRRVVVRGDARDHVNAFVRARIHVTAEDMRTLDEEAMRQTLFAGAKDVKFEYIVKVQQRVRCEAIATARSTWAKFLAYLAAAGIELTEPQLERCRAKLSSIEEIVGSGRGDV